ncbi:MAG: SigB/SigF/SigG family RNA polymerase sigma factor [Clostridiales bacterium]|nr:SigB/SigF/SigG family RNA polymerase sigma factor [Clostridiales bacterium]MCD8108558.1 SigB/SigF/SigG family RNA polymerase sigma factor [Clostridiales bacterium]MCD8133853.1 SigB/SigF/SigG family RNA polymerase sigma factor [Clostridiales bacterium]
MGELECEIRRAHEGDKEARDGLVHKNIGLVWSIVRRFSNRGYDPEDLFQVGSIGLIKAIDHFDPDYNVKFSTYAVPLITGEIRRFLRDDGMVKVSRTLKENGWKVSREAEKWRNLYGREATLEELSAQTGLSVEDIVMAGCANAEVDSLSRPVSGCDGKEVMLQEQIQDEKNEMEARVNHVFLEEALAGLESAERRLIWLRYFQGKTQTDVAKLLGTTQVQVSRMEKRLLEKMRLFA